MAQKAPEIFRRGDFCKSVTEYTRDELLGFVTREYIEPMARHLEKEKTKNDIPRGIPRFPAEESADRTLIFMNSRFRADLRDIPAEELYQAFAKLKKHYDYIGSEASWGPAIYIKIEEAHEKGNEAELKGAIIELVDKIIHD